MVAPRTILQRLIGPACLLWLLVACGSAPTGENEAVATAEAPESRTVNPVSLPSPTADSATPERPGTVSTADIEGTQWLLARYGPQENPVPALQDYQITAEIYNLGELHGSAGCNTYFAAFELDGQALAIVQVEHTEKACADTEVMRQEATYLAALRSASALQLEGDTLTISYDGGQLQFDRVPPPAITPLDGTSWLLTAFESGASVNSPVAGTPITAEFAGGTIRGSAGCNDYGGSYSLDGTTIAFDEIGASAAECEAAIMVQEVTYLAALRTARSLIVDGNQLRLEHAEGTLVVTRGEADDAADAFLQQTLPEEVARQAELIILGRTVGPQVSERLPPGSPLAPSEPPGEPDHNTPPYIYTETQVQVERALKGAAPGDTLRVRTLGGTVDGQSMAMTHTPELRVDQRVVLFLKQVEPGYYVILGEDGVYEIVDDVAIGARHRFPLSELLTRIED